MAASVPGSVAAPVGQVSVPGGMLVQAPQPQMATYMSYPNPTPMATVPTEQPYTGPISNMEFHRNPAAAAVPNIAAYNVPARQQPRRPAQQLYVPPSHRAQPM